VDVKQVLTRYPTLCSVAEHAKLKTDLEAAAAAAATDDCKGLWRAHDAKAFAANELTFWLTIHEFGGLADNVADELERGLVKVVGAVGVPAARAAYRDKLLISDPRQFIDVRYEISAAGGSVDFFDAGTLKLEQGIGAAKRNSDMKGMRRGKPVRMEVRVVHDDWPPSLDPALEKVMLAADIPVGYSVLLSSMPNAAVAAEVKALVEALHAASGTQRTREGEPVLVKGVDFWFEPMEEKYEASGGTAVVSSIAFVDDRGDRSVHLPAFTRSMVDPHERDFFKNPAGVQVFSGEMADPRTYKDLPFSTKIGQAIANKAGQCETGIANIVVLGTPSPMADHDVVDALEGARAATFVGHADASFMASGMVAKGSGMFVPAEYSESVDNFIAPYKIISGVWHIRLGVSAPQSRIFRNPNASVPLLADDAEALAKTLPQARRL
jgi:hypothetical protein